MFRVLIADDQAIARTGLATLIDTIGDATVVGTASDGEECLRLARRLKPDVAVIDLGEDRLGAIDTARRLRNATPQVGVLMVSRRDDDATVFPALRVGARGYLLADTDGEELGRAIRTVADGGAHFCRAVARRVMRYLADAPPPTTSSALADLTLRELETLELIARGYTNAEIGERLGQSSKTVSNNVSRILQKLQAPDRARLMLLALDAGLGRSPAK